MVRSGGGSFQHPLTEPLFSRQPSYLPPFLSLCFFFSSAFKMTVHPSVQLANWALTMTGPLVNSDHWNPYRRAAFQHLHFLYRNHRHLSGTDPLLPLRRLSEAGRGQETKQLKNNLSNSGVDNTSQNNV